MGVVGNINAESGFNQIKSSFTQHVTDVGGVLESFDLIADDAIKNVNDDTGAVNPVIFLTAAEIESAAIGTVPESPSEPVAAEVFSEALQYLEWLQTQTLNSDVFPVYSEVVTASPTAPTVDVTDIDGRLSYSSPAVPVVNVPEWDESLAWSNAAEAAVTGGAELTDTFSYTSPDYVSPLIGSGGGNVLYEYVLREIESGSFGIDENEEERLFERMKDREERVMAGAVDAARRLFSSGGFTMPTGAGLAAEERIRAESRDKLSSANREMASVRANLYLEGKKIALANGLQLEQQTMAFHNATADRLLKSVTDGIQATIAVAAHNLQRSKMFIEKYVAFSSAFEARVKASVSVVELYKSQVEAEQAKAALNRSLVDELVAKNKAVVDTYMAQVEGYKAEIDNRVKYHGVLSDFYKTKAAEIEYRSRAVVGAYDLAEKSESNMVQFRIGKYNAEVAASKAAVDNVMAALNIRVDQIKSMLSAQTSLAMGAMSGMNANLSLSVSGSASISGSESASEATDVSAGVVRRSESTTTSYEPDAVDEFYYHNING